MSTPPKTLSMPLERAILWNPPVAGGGGTTNPGKSSSRTPYPIFFQQEAVIALQEHLKSSPTQAIFGFLIGDVYRDPEAGALYTIIDKTLKLSQAIYGDKTEVVVSRLWERMQEQLRKASATLLGWYHSHPGQGGYLTQHDVETHEKFFTEPWHVAVLVAAEAGGLTGRFFRSSQANADWFKTPLPFHELLQPESIKPDGKKRSFITWRNYKPFGPTLTGPKPKPPEPPPPAPKDEEPEEKEAPEKPKTEKKGGLFGFRIMRSSADDIPVIKTAADDEPAPPPKPEPPPPPLREPPPPPARREDAAGARGRAGTEAAAPPPAAAKGSGEDQRHPLAGFAAGGCRDGDPPHADFRPAARLCAAASGASATAAHLVTEVPAARTGSGAEAGTETEAAQAARSVAQAVCHSPRAGGSGHGRLLVLWDQESAHAAGTLRQCEAVRVGRDEPEIGGPPARLAAPARPPSTSPSDD